MPMIPKSYAEFEALPESPQKQLYLDLAHRVSLASAQDQWRVDRQRELDVAAHEARLAEAAVALALKAAEARQQLADLMAEHLGYASRTLERLGVVNVGDVPDQVIVELLASWRSRVSRGLELFEADLRHLLLRG